MDQEKRSLRMAHLARQIRRAGQPLGVSILGQEVVISVPEAPQAAAYAITPGLAFKFAADLMEAALKAMEPHDQERVRASLKLVVNRSTTPALR